MLFVSTTSVSRGLWEKLSKQDRNKLLTFLFVAIRSTVKAIENESSDEEEEKLRSLSWRKWEWKLCLLRRELKRRGKEKYPGSWLVIKFNFNPTTSPNRSQSSEIQTSAHYRRTKGETKKWKIRPSRSLERESSGESCDLFIFHSSRVFFVTR